MRRVVFVAWVLVCGCTPDFDDPWKVLDLRILAIRAEPPEVFVHSIATPVPPVELEVLAVDPRPSDASREVDWELWACTPDETRCEEADRREQVRRTRSRLDQIRATFVPSAEILRASLLSDPFLGFGGIPMILEFRLDDGEYEVRGFKRLVYTVPLPYSPIPAGKRPNRNPTLVGIDVDGKRVESGDDVDLERGKDHVLLPVIAEGDKETYVVVTADDKPGTPVDERATSQRALEEFISYAYFTTMGTLSNATTGGRPSPFFDNKKVDDISATFRLQAQDTDDRADLWVVVRDDRGGVNWATFRARLIGVDD